MLPMDGIYIILYALMIFKARWQMVVDQPRFLPFQNVPEQDCQQATQHDLP